MGLDDVAFRSFCDEAHEGVLVAEIASRRPIYANAAFAQMFGYTRDEILELNVTDLHPPEALPAVERDFETLARDKLDRSVQTCMRKDGTLFPAQIHEWPFMVEGRPFAAGFFEDITERKRLEDDLKERIKEFKCLESIAAAVESGKGLDHIYQPSVEALSEAFQYPDVACARIALGDDSWQTEDFHETEWRLASDLRVTTTRSWLARRL